MRASTTLHDLLLRTTGTALPLALAVALAGGCTSGLESQTRVSDMRVLAIRAEPPMVLPGDEVELSALVVDPWAGPGEQPTISWYACMTPEPLERFFGADFEYGDAPCDDPDHPEGVLLGEGPVGTTARFTVPEDFLAHLGEALTAYGLGGSEEEQAGITALLLNISGLHLRVRAVVTNGTKTTDAFKRLVVSTNPEPNVSPDPPAVFFANVDEVSFDDAPETGEPPPAGTCLVPSSAVAIKEGKWHLKTLNLPEDPPTYYVISFTDDEEPFQERTEGLYFSWFSTAGSLNDLVTRETFPWNGIKLGKVKPTELVRGPDGGPVVPLWVVVRDGRGGTSWCESLIPYEGEVLLPEAEPPTTTR